MQRGEVLHSGWRSVGRPRGTMRSCASRALRPAGGRWQCGRVQRAQLFPLMDEEGVKVSVACLIGRGLVMDAASTFAPPAPASSSAGFALRTGRGASIRPARFAPCRTLVLEAIAIEE